jgi:hypothetical protein
MIPRIMSAEQLYHAFTVIPRMRYRVVVYAEQRVDDRWVEMSTTELATFAGRNREPRMPTRPPPPPLPPTAAEDQVVPSTPPQEPAQPSSDAPGAMRSERRAREDRLTRQRTTPPPRPSQSPLARRPPRPHRMMVPGWAVVANDIWFACPMCAESVAHSGVVCGQCEGRPACCECMILMEVSRYSEGRCPFCRYSGPE